MVAIGKPSFFKNFHFSTMIFQVRTLEERKKLMEKILKHDQKRRKKIEAASIE